MVADLVMTIARYITLKREIYILARTETINRIDLEFRNRGSVSTWIEKQIHARQRNQEPQARVERRFLLSIRR
jgi:hypothetical protein